LREVIELPLMNPELFEVGQIGHVRAIELTDSAWASSRPREFCCTALRGQVSQLAPARLVA
jgi:hypothetical protein